MIDLIKKMVGSVVAFIGYLFLFGAGISLYNDPEFGVGVVISIVIGLLALKRGRELQSKRMLLADGFQEVDQALLSQVVRYARHNERRVTLLEAENRFDAETSQLTRVFRHLENHRMARLQHVRNLGEFAEVYHFPELISHEEKMAAEAMMEPPGRFSFNPLTWIDRVDLWRSRDERELLRFVEIKGGKVTVSELVAETNLYHSVIAPLLRFYVARGQAHRQMLIQEGEEITVYSFPGMVNRRQKSQARHMSSQMMAHEAEHQDLVDDILKKS